MQSKTMIPIVIHGALNGDPHTGTELAEAPPMPPPRTADRPAHAPVETPLAPAVQRVLSLDALRGVLMLAMNFSFAIPLSRLFADWMFHMQYPPPGDFVERPGLT